MDYRILETHLTFDNNVLIAVAVLWSEFGEVRSSYSDLQRMSGYHYLKDYDVFPSSKLFNQVAKGGRKLTDMQKKRYFPKIKH
jgi:hypothetical protein